MTQHKNSREKGFTIIELMIATTVFSVILLVASASVIQIGRIYYKGLISTRAQENARYIMENVSRDLQFSNTNGLDIYTPTYNFGLPDPNPLREQAYCIGSKKYSYFLNQPATDGNPGLVLSDASPGDCTPDFSGQEMLGANMRLLRFNISPNASDGTYAVGVAIAYGDNDLLSIYDDQSSLLPGVDKPQIAGALCKSGVAGSNFCATSMLDTTVKRRIH